MDMIEQLSAKDAWKSYAKFYDRIRGIAHKIAPIHANCIPENIERVEVDKWYPIQDSRIAMWLTIEFYDDKDNEEEPSIVIKPHVIIDENCIWSDDYWVSEYELQAKKLKIASLDLRLEQLKESIQRNSNYIEKWQSNILELMEERNSLVEELKNEI